MLTGDIRNKVDRIWDAFWSGGISNPLTVIEQITYMLFIKRLDELHIGLEKKANTLKKPIENPIFPEGLDFLRWSRFKDMEPEQMFQNFTRNDKKKPGVFQFIKELNGNSESSYAIYMKDAVFMMPNPQLLERVVTMLDDIPMEKRDMKGDLYEYLLSKLSTAGQNGQFRTPRHIIKMMVEIIAPEPDDIICDPACGTGGFLVQAGEYLRDTHDEIFHNKKQTKHFLNDMFYGLDFDASMLRIGVMNMVLHGIENPHINGKDALSESNADNREMCTVILANPPFKGSLDYDSVANDLLSVAKTRKTELLFISLFLNMLKVGEDVPVLFLMVSSSALPMLIRRYARPSLTVISSKRLSPCLQVFLNPMPGFLLLLWFLPGPIPAELIMFGSMTCRLTAFLSMINGHPLMRRSMKRIIFLIL